MRQVLKVGALGRSKRMGWGGRWEQGSGWGIHVNPWLIHVNAWQNPLQYCKVIHLQLTKINGKKKKTKTSPFSVPPSPWQPPFHFLSLWIWLLWVDYIRAIMQHLSFCYWLTSFRASLVAQLEKNLPVMWETSVQSRGWEDPLEKNMATHTGILAWRIPWAVYSMGSQRVGHNWVTFTFYFTYHNVLRFIYGIVWV